MLLAAAEGLSRFWRDHCPSQSVTSTVAHHVHLTPALSATVQTAQNLTCSLLWTLRYSILYDTTHIINHINHSQASAPQTYVGSLDALIERSHHCQIKWIQLHPLDLAPLCPVPGTQIRPVTLSPWFHSPHTELARVISTVVR